MRYVYYTPYAKNLIKNIYIKKNAVVFCTLGVDAASYIRVIADCIKRNKKTVVTVFRKLIATIRSIRHENVPGQIFYGDSTC